MTKQQWLDYAKEHQAVLISLLDNYHPVNLDKRARITEDSDGKFIVPQSLPITAPNAERACQSIRNEIALKTINPAVSATFLNALEHNDINTINSLLNAAWFGVPESNSCWEIVGFREAVELMEDFPEDE